MSTDKLSLMLTDYNIAHTIDDYGEVHISAGVVHVRIAPRQWYCDRGRWLVHAESNDPRVVTIDHADGFPRYYFHESCLAQELWTWLKYRKDRQRKQEVAT